MPKYLYLLRHAKAEPGELSLSDHERPLAPRGVDDAADFGSWMAENQIIPTAIHISTAARTKQTWDQIATHNPGLITHYDDALYLASAGELMGFIQQQSAETQSIMIIGHNPGLHQLAHLLARRESGEAYRALAQHFPTTACAILVFEGMDWADIAPESGRLDAFWTRHGLHQEA